MKHIELIFILISLVTITYIIAISVKFIKYKNIKEFLAKLVCSLLILLLGFIWFVPITIGYSGEAPICKFRFSVFAYECDDYGGYGNFTDIIINPKPEKYGCIRIFSKVGGIKEYFNLKPLDEKITRDFE